MTYLGLNVDWNGLDFGKSETSDLSPSLALRLCQGAIPSAIERGGRPDLMFSTSKRTSRYTILMIIGTLRHDPSTKGMVDRVVEPRFELLLCHIYCVIDCRDICFIFRAVKKETKPLTHKRTQIQKAKSEQGP